MAENIRRYEKMVSLVGYSHIIGLHQHLGEEVACMVTSKVEPPGRKDAGFWHDRYKLAAEISSFP